ncbi:MAG: hypothetical protein FJY67_02400 [Calditrichaeota bacterium]|nr:hypothetical protein [Calditrichota bacterium]
MVKLKHLPVYSGRCVLLLLMPLLVVSAGLAAFQDDYDRAFKKYQASRSNSDYESAAAAFAALSARSDAGSLRPNCIYWEGECWYGAKEYLRALMAFERTLVTPQSNKEEDARFKVAVCHVKLNWNDSAKVELSRFLRDFPASRHIAAVRRELDRLTAESGGR